MSERKDKTTTKVHVMQIPRRQAKGQTSSTTCKRTPSDRHIVLPDDCNTPMELSKYRRLVLFDKLHHPRPNKKTHTHIYIYNRNKKHAHENDESQVGTSAVTRCHKNIKILLSLMSLGHRSFFRCWALIDFLPRDVFSLGQIFSTKPPNTQPWREFQKASLSSTGM